MNRSTFKKVIKENIISILKEEENSIEVGSRVTIPKDLTTDPINKQGEEGEVIHILPNFGYYIVHFDDGKMGKYSLNVFDGVNEATIETTVDDLDDVKDEAEDEDTIKVVDVNEYDEINTDAKFDDDNLGNEDESEVNIADLKSEIKHWNDVKAKLDPSKKIAIVHIDGILSHAEELLQTLEGEDLNEVSSDEMYNDILKAKDLDGVNKALGNPTTYTNQDINKKFGGLSKFKKHLIKNLKKGSIKNQDLDETYNPEEDEVIINTEKLQKHMTKMKSKAKEYKAAEGEAKEKLKDELKKLTKEKKSIEASL